MNGRAAMFTRDGGQELTVIPTSGTSAGSKFTVTIDYTGTPSVVTNPDESIEGWVPTHDAAFVVGEPQGSPTWYPCNDNPRDKATFDFSVTVPDGLTAMANGVLVSSASSGGRTTWVWKEADPMATYLATTTPGRFDLTVSELPVGARRADARARAVAHVVRRLGHLAFFQLLRDWATQNRYGSLTTPQFVALAEKESGMNLTAFFDAWIYQDAKPTAW